MGLALVAGVGDHDVKGAKAGLDVLHKAGNVFFLVHVGHEAGNPLLARAELGQQGVDLRLSGGRKGDLRAFRQKALHNGSSDAAGSAGDQNNLVLQFEIHDFSS